MKEKKFWLTKGRERDVLRYSVSSDQKDAEAYSFEEACAVLCERIPAYSEITSKNKTRAEGFLEEAVEHAKIYNDWLIYASR